MEAASVAARRDRKSVPQPCRDRRRGQTLVEMALVLFLLLAVLFGSFEMDRMLLTHTSLANAAYAAVRYAAVHGFYALGRQNYDATSTQAVQTVAKTFASFGILDPSTVTVTVTYPDLNNNMGSHVAVTVTAPYQPFTSFFPLAVTLGSKAQGTFCY